MQTKHTPSNFLMSNNLTLSKTIPKGFSSILKAITFITCFYFLCNQEVNAQTYPKVHQESTYNAVDNSSSLEVFTTILQCESNAADTLYLKVYNLKSKKDTANFDVTIYNEGKTNSTTIKNISVILNSSAIAYPTCGTGEYRNLAIALPSGYDPKKSTVKVVFN